MMLPANEPVALWSLIAAITSGAIALVAAIAAICAAKYARAAPTKEDIARVEQSAAAVSGQAAKVEARLASMNDDLKRAEGRAAEASGHLDGIRSHLAAMNEDLKRVGNITAETSSHLRNLHSYLEAMNRRLDTQQERDALAARANSVPLRFIGDVEPGRDGQFTITTKDESVVLNKIDLCSEAGNKFGSAPCEPWNPPLQMLVRLNAMAFMKWYEAGSLVGNFNQDRELHLRVYMKVMGIAEEVSRSMTIRAKTMMPQQAGQGMTPLKYRLHGEV